MSAFNGAGTFVISGVGLPFVTGTTISSTVANQLNTDLATGLSNCITKDGQTTPVANIPMGGFKITGLGAPTAPGDALVFGQPVTVSDVIVTGNKNPNAVLIGPITGPAAPPTWRALDPADIPAGAQDNANLLTNGDCRIDQRNAGAAVNFSFTAGFIVDRFNGVCGNLTTQTLTGQQVASTLAGCVKAIKYTVGGVGAAPAANTYAASGQRVEGQNFAQLLWGTAQAKPITMSFRAKASVAGNYGVSFRNQAGDRSYMASFALVANTDTPVVLNVPGDTVGNWMTDNGIGMQWSFDLGVGASFVMAAGAWAAGNLFGLTGGTKLIATTGATFEVGNLKLEAGSIATPLVPDDFEVSLAKCQRYFQRHKVSVANQTIAVLSSYNGNSLWGVIKDLPVTMRATPTASYSALGHFLVWSASAGGSVAPNTISLAAALSKLLAPNVVTAAAGFVAGEAHILSDAGSGFAYFDLDAEL